jgi:hypothetical protein
MPEGWFVDAATGAAVTDPAKSAAGVLQPMGEYKGSGLALMIGLIAGVLNGAAFGRDVVDFNADDESATNTGHAIIAVDIARFVPLKTFTAEVDRHLRDLRGSRLLPGFDAIRLPGERRAACRDERSRDGVPVPAPLLAQLDKLAAELQIKPLRAVSDASEGKLDPHLDPPPFRGRKDASGSRFSPPARGRDRVGVAAALTPLPTLPHKEGGNMPFLAH